MYISKKYAHNQIPVIFYGLHIHTVAVNWDFNYSFSHSHVYSSMSLNGHIDMQVNKYFYFKCSSV